MFVQFLTATKWVGQLERAVGGTRQLPGHVYKVVKHTTNGSTASKGRPREEYDKDYPSIFLVPPRAVQLAYLPYSTPLCNRFGAVFGCFCRLRGEISISQNWLEG